MTKQAVWSGKFIQAWMGCEGRKMTKCGQKRRDGWKYEGRRRKEEDLAAPVTVMGEVAHGGGNKMTKPGSCKRLDPEPVHCLNCFSSLVVLWPVRISAGKRHWAEAVAETEAAAKAEAKAESHRHPTPARWPTV